MIYLYLYCLLTASGLLYCLYLFLSRKPGLQVFLITFGFYSLMGAGMVVGYFQKDEIMVMITNSGAIALSLLVAIYLTYWIKAGKKFILNTTLILLRGLFLVYFAVSLLYRIS